MGNWKWNGNGQNGWLNTGLISAMSNRILCRCRAVAYSVRPCWADIILLKSYMTRFWNWQDSPIPITAPDIAPLQLGSRAQEEDLKAGNFSQPLVNIVSPTSLPEPTGMAAALQTIANGNMFRDMSGSGIYDRFGAGQPCIEWPRSRRSRGTSGLQYGDGCKERSRNV